MKGVYFIRATHGGGPIKIGHSIDVDRRIADMQPCCPYELEILAVAEGDYMLERRFHSHFAADNVRLEWFSPTVSILSAIEQIKAGTFDFNQLPEKGLRSWVIRQRQEKASKLEAAA